MKALLLLFLAAQLPGQLIHKVIAFPDLPDFVKPVFLTHAGDKTDRVFVVEQAGKIIVFENQKTVSSRAVFLDIRLKVSSHGHERGLLGLAFDPKYKYNGYVYVYYTTQTHGVVARYSASEWSEDAVDPTTEKILLSVRQRYSNHNGGMLAFGPDKHLYLSLGDDAIPSNAQNVNTLLGGIVRFDNQYNPVLYAWGLRNPWRFSFDRVTGLLICGDVGQGKREEINVIVKGGNYGWPYKEGTYVWQNPPVVVNDPVTDYGRGRGTCVIGGYVYRGNIKPLSGAYFYGDHGSAKVWMTNGYLQIEATTVNELSSFGEDEKGELYMLSLDGPVYRIEL